MPANWTACVTSWNVTHSSSCSTSTSMVSAALRTFGATSSSRVGALGSNRRSSSWPSTLRPMKPTIPPISAASSRPPAERSGPASGPPPAPIRSTTGSSVARIVARLACVQVARSTASAGGSAPAGVSRA
jgi:hypothetical protein